MSLAPVAALASDVMDGLRSLQGIPTFAQAVEELVLNSLDAQARKVQVRVHMQDLSIEVTDNGCGVTIDQLAILGTTRYATSKPSTITYGFRGEALASIGTMGLLEITSRARREGSQLACESARKVRSATAKRTHPGRLA